MKKKFIRQLRDYLNTSGFDSYLLTLTAHKQICKTGQRHNKEVKLSNSAAFAALLKDWARKSNQMTTIGFGDYQWQPASF